MWRRVITYTIVCLAVMFLSTTALFHTARGPLAPPPSAEPVQISVSPSTLITAQETQVRFQVTGELTAKSITAQVSELSFRQELDAGNLKGGVTAQIAAARPGIYHVQILAEGREIARVPITVGIGAELGAGPRPALAVTAGKPRLDATHANMFVIPVYAVAQTARANRKVPKPADRDVKVLFRGEGVPAGLSTVIPRGSARSDPANLPFDPGSSYAVTAHAPGHAESEPLSLAWKDHQGLLDLHAEPAEMTRYATPSTTAEVTVYLKHGGLLVRPPRPVKVLANHPPDVTGPSSIELSPRDGDGAWEARAVRTVRDASIEFVEPAAGLRTSVKISFLFPTLMILEALVCGVLGVAAARRGDLLNQTRVKIVFEVAAAAIGGALLYASAVQEWIPFVVKSSDLVGWIPAATVGVVGGYGGEGTFQGIMKLLKLFGSSPTP